LKIFHHQSQQKWDENLHLLLFAFNTACRENTKMCPEKLFLGRDLGMPIESMWDLTEVKIAHELIGGQISGLSQ
jgi:hypothetical protein